MHRSIPKHIQDKAAQATLDNPTHYVGIVRRPGGTHAIYTAADLDDLQYAYGGPGVMWSHAPMVQSN